MGKKKRHNVSGGKSKALDCIYCFETCRVDSLTRRVICAHCVALDAPLEFPELRKTKKGA